MRQEDQRLKSQLQLHSDREAKRSLGKTLKPEEPDLIDTAHTRSGMFLLGTPYTHTLEPSSGAARPSALLIPPRPCDACAATRVSWPSARAQT